MFSLFGSKKIKISLIISLFFLILINAFILTKILKKDDIPTAAFDCKEFDKEIKYQADQKNKTWELLGDRELVFNYCEYFVKNNNKYYSILFIEQDNQTYFMNLITLNVISKELEKLYKQYQDYNVELDNYKSLNTLQKIRILELLKLTQVKQYKIVDPFNKVYFKIFDSDNYIFIFIIFVNFLCFILTIYLMIGILKNIFTYIDKKLFFLITLNIFFLPFNLIYYLNFYKEPFIFLSLIMIIFNFFYLLNQKKNTQNIIYSTILISLALIIIKFFKFPYQLIYILIFLLGGCILILKSKSFKDRIILFLQIILILTFTTSLNINNIIYDNFAKIKNPASKFIKDKISTFDFFDKNSKSSKLYFSLKNKTVTDSPSNVDVQKNELFSNNYKLKKLEDYKHLVCDEPFTKLCKKINNFAHTTYYIKYATIYENRNNPNIVNSDILESTEEIIFSLPISTVKGFIMPVKFSDNIIIILISIFKITLFLFLVYFSILLYRAKKYIILEKIFYIVLFLMPLSLAIDLVTSNYFTYFRYVMPINILLLIIIFFSIVEIFFRENVKHNS